MTTTPIRRDRRRPEARTSVRIWSRLPVSVLRKRLGLAGPRADAMAAIVVIVGVLIANAPYLLHLADGNPMGTLSLLSSHVKAGMLPGQSYIDPNIAFTAQALGHRAALNMLHGGSLWWNPYEGLGTPLAGEMNAAALFPPSVLMASANGTLYFHLLLESIAGVSTLALLRLLGLHRCIAIAGGVAFGLNGSLAWLFHSAGNPIAFLPLSLVGVELAWRRSAEARRFGWLFIGVGVALSLYAGFPEVALIDGILVGLWTIVRASSLERRPLKVFSLEVASGLLWAVLLAAPILVAFADYLPNANVGAHGGGLSHLSLPASTAPTVLMPYAFGPIFGWTAINPVGPLTQLWDNVGGYLTALLLFLALVGTWGTRHRRLRLALAGWLLICVSRTFGLGMAIAVLNLLPGVKLTAFYRYAPASWELAAIVLAMFGLDDIIAHRVSRRTVVISAALVLTGILLSTVDVLHVIRYVAGAPHNHLWLFASLIWASGTVSLVFGLSLFWRSRGLVVMVVGLVLLDAIVMFMVPEFSAPRHASVDTRPVAFLRQHLGEERFFTLGPIQPNYGSYFGIAEVNVNDLPVPKLWHKFIGTRLNRNVNPITFTGNVVANPDGPSNVDELMANFEAYREIGVKYVVASAGMALPSALDGLVRAVFDDATVRIYEVSDPAPFFSATGCLVRSLSPDNATADCARTSELHRLELSMPGWRATVNGASVHVRTVNQLTQAVALPAGQSVVRFSFRPPRVDLGLYLLFLAALGGFIALVVEVTVPAREPDRM